jgi:hypothetical protein
MTGTSDNVERVTFLVTFGISVFSLAITIFYFNWLTLSPENARSLFEKIVDIDGIMLGFAAVAIGLISGRIKLSVEVLLLTVLPAGALYLISIWISFLGIATAATSGSSFVLPLWLMIAATDFLFAMLAMIGYETRVQQANNRDQWMKP